MTLLLTEEQAMLRDSVRGLLADHAPVSALRALRDTRDPDGFSRDAWRHFAEHGVCGVLVPEGLGGLGLGHREAGVVMEAIGHHLAASPFLATSIVAATALQHGGSAAQQQAWLPRLAGGEALATLAVDEGAKHRPAHVALRATPAGDGVTLHGAKTFVVDGHVADLLVVAARSAGHPGDADGLTLCLVERAAAGVHVERTIMVDAHNAARITFDGVSVAPDAVLGARHAGGETLARALDAGRAAAAAELLGLADEAFARTVDYLKQRRQFGRLIGEFQALQHRAAILYTELEVARAAVLHAQRCLDADPGAGATREAVAIAKACAGRAATLAVQEGVQMHGGIGMTDACEMGFFMKRARVLQELFGDAHWQLDQLALRRGY